MPRASQLKPAAFSFARRIKSEPDGQVKQLALSRDRKRPVEAAITLDSEKLQCIR